MRIKFVVLALFLFIVSTVPAFAQPGANPELAKYITDNYTKREAMVPMRDGVNLFTSIYETKDKSQKYPILMSRTPYSVAP